MTVTRLYDIQEAAKVLHLTVAGLRTLRHKAQGPVGIKVGRRVMWTEESLDRYVARLQADADMQRQHYHEGALSLKALVERRLGDL